jgi:hypothetical protein
VLSEINLKTSEKHWDSVLLFSVLILAKQICASFKMNLEENEVRHTAKKMGFVIRKFIVEKYASRCLTALQPIVQELVKVLKSEISERDAKLAEQDTEIKGYQKQLLEANEKNTEIKQELEDYRQSIREEFAIFKNVQGKAIESFERESQRPAQLPSSQRPASFQSAPGTEVQMEILSDMSCSEEDRMEILSDISGSEEDHMEILSDISGSEDQSNQFYECSKCGIHLKDSRPGAIDRHEKTNNCQNAAKAAAKAAKQAQSRAGPRQGRSRSRSGLRQGRSLAIHRR